MNFNLGVEVCASYCEFLKRFIIYTGNMLMHVERWYQKLF